MKENYAKDKVLLLLKGSNDYISGEELSKRMGITRSAIWKYIKALRGEGYEIDSVTNKGYKLINSTGVLNAMELEEGLQTKTLGKRLVFLQSVDSTNQEVKRLAAQDAPHGTVVVAEQQLTGKGRLGRVWSSPPGTGIWFSFLLRPQLPPSKVSGITLAAGLGVCMAIRQYTGLNALIKWPNDVIIGNKKVCGILTEMTAEDNRIDYAVVGIGINVNTKEFDAEIRSKATSLSIEAGSDINRAELFKAVLKYVEHYIDLYLTDLEKGILPQYTGLCATIGRRVRVVRGSNTLEGEAVSIGSHGDLNVRLDGGSIVAVNSGEVTVQGIY